MIKFEYIYSEMYLAMLLLSLIVLLLHRLQNNSLLVIIITFFIGYIIYYYLYEISKQKEESITNTKKTINEDIEGRLEISDESFFNMKFPKSLKYLKESDELMLIVSNVRFVRKFNKSVYGDLLNNLNSLMKVYIYILSERYSTTQIKMFIDLRDNIMELMYSFILLVPSQLKHTYGFNAYDEIHKSIEDFTKHSRTMLEILDSFSKDNSDDIYIPIDNFKPYNSVQSSFFP